MAPYAESKGVPTPESAVTLSRAATYFGRSQPFAWRKTELGALAIIGLLAGVSPVMLAF